MTQPDGECLMAHSANLPRLPVEALTLVGKEVTSYSTRASFRRL